MFHRKTPVDRPHGLISVLQDVRAEYGDRGDAAMDLAEYDEPEAEAALLEVALNGSADPDLADEAGHSLWQIWQRKGKSDPEVVARLHPEARKFFDGGPDA